MIGGSRNREEKSLGGLELEAFVRRKVEHVGWVP